MESQTLQNLIDRLWKTFQWNKDLVVKIGKKRQPLYVIVGLWVPYPLNYEKYIPEVSSAINEERDSW